MTIQNNRALALLLFLTVICYTHGFAQKILFRNYTITDGLCANTIWDIEQDEQGFMWFGTKYGLNRFDGYEFKSYQHNKNIKGTIGNNFIRKIFKKDRYTFWIGTDEGIYIFDLKTENFHLFEPLGKLFVNDIYQGRNGEIWIATKEKGVFRYESKSKSLINLNADKNEISSNEISKIIEDNDGRIWIGTYGKGIDVLSPKNNTFKHYKASGKQGDLSSNVILELYKDLEGQIWIGTMSGGLNVWNKKENNFKVYQKSNTNSISDNIVRAIYQTEPGVLHIATEKGLNIFDIKRNHFSAYQNKNNDAFSINDDAVYTVFKDREAGVWVGTYFGGLNYYHEKGLGFEYYYPSGVSNSLSGNAVSAFLETRPGNMWIGTEDGGLNFFNTADKSFKKFPYLPNQDTLSYHNIHALFEDKSGKIWIGMYTGGLNILNPKTGKIKRYKSTPGNPNTLSDNSIYSIDEDREERIWISTISGLNLYDPKNDSFIRIKGKKLEKSCIYQVYQDKEGILWIATYDNGLIRMDKNNTLKQYAYTNRPGSISSNKVISILDDDEGNLWLGTDGGGLNSFNKKSEKFSVYDESFGIKSTVIYGILKDNSGKFWLSSNSGIYEFDPKAKSLRNFGKWDNLQSQQYNYKAFYQNKGGKMYFGGINGFNAFYPDQIKPINHDTPVAFTNFQLFNKNLNLADEDSPINQTINFASSIQLNHNQSVVSIEYAALSFIAPNKIQYAFKMEGFDKDWNYVGEQRKATYTNLPAGEYTFIVKVIDDSAHSSNKTASIKIVILPPYYKTRVAYFIYLLLLIAAVYFIRKTALNKARKRNEIKLERLKNKSEQDFYKQKIEFFTAMAHEIRTPLSLIIAPLENLLRIKQKDAESATQLQIMEENSDRLLTLVNQLLDFRRIESDIFEIHTEEMELVSFIFSIKDRFSAMTFQRGINLSIKTDLKRLDLMADPEALTKIISNLLINAFKFTRKNVEIRINELVKSEKNQELVSISVEDDGIGIPKEQLDSIFTKFFKVATGEHQYSNLGGTGIGLALAKSLIEKHDGQLLVESEEGLKTKFTIFFPYIRNKAEAILLNTDLQDTQQMEGKLSILVLEDDLSLLNFLSNSLITDGYHVIRAGNGQEGLNMLDQHQVDFVISDVMMPIMNGFEFCKIIKNDINYSHLPVILLTARTNSEAEIEGLESGADAYIPKPFKWRQVSLVIRNLIDLQVKLKQRFAQLPFEGIEVLPSGSKDKVFLNKLIEAIEGRISDPLLSVEVLGKEVGLSRSSLYKKVKAMTGHVPNEFIRLIRLKTSARLLSTREYNISEIGYMVGFSSHSYFSKCFYQQFKLTPTEFVEKHANDKIELENGKYNVHE